MFLIVWHVSEISQRKKSSLEQQNAFPGSYHFLFCEHIFLFIRMSIGWAGSKETVSQHSGKQKCRLPINRLSQNQAFMRSQERRMSLLHVVQKIQFIMYIIEATTAAVLSNENSLVEYICVCFNWCLFRSI